jgi:4-hydroxy-2-oxoheptanedioate aldolase
MSPENDWPRRHGLRAKLSERQVIATFTQVPHPMVCAWVGHMGFDAICIDTEHTAVDRAMLETLVAVTQSTPAAALVRVQGNDPLQIAAALDAGASGIVVPRIGSAEEALAAVAATRYPPVGERGFGPARASAYRADPGYLANANDDILLAVQVETRSAVEDLDAILAVDEVDLIFLGPGDLSVSLGIGFPSPELDRALADVVTRAQQAKKLTGIFVLSAEDAKRWLDAGVDLVMGPGELIFAQWAGHQWLTDLSGDTVGDENDS